MEDITAPTTPAAVQALEKATITVNASAGLPTSEAIKAADKAVIAQKGWIKRTWDLLPEEEQKLIAGILAAAIAAGVLHTGTHGIAIDPSLLGVVVVRYFTDNWQRILS